jgi:hypothetical protein
MYIICNTYHGISLAALGIDDVVQLVGPCSVLIPTLQYTLHMYVYDLLRTMVYLSPPLALMT